MKHSQWIVSAKWDLCFFSGSVLLTYLYYAVYKLFLFLPEEHFLHRYAALIATLAFYALFDHPHIFQTFSRTHADTSEFQRRPFMYTYGLMILIFSGFLIKYFHVEDTFEIFLNVYGIWHILRQNSGFLKLYKKKAEEISRIDVYFDNGLLYGTVLIFLAIRVFDHSRTPLDWMPYWEADLRPFYGILVLGLILYTLRQLYLIKEKKLSYPKIIFLTAIVSTYYFVYVVSDPPFGLLIALETIYHDVQYQGWILNYQMHRFEKNIWKTWLARSLIYGLVFGTLLTLSLRYDGIQWFLIPFLMMVLFHYFIDGRIWRFSKNKELKAVVDI